MKWLFLQIAVLSVLFSGECYAQKRDWIYNPLAISPAYTRSFLYEAKSDTLGGSAVLVVYANGDSLAGYRFAWISPTGKELHSEEFGPSGATHILRVTPKVVLLVNDQGIIRYALQKGKVVKTGFAREDGEQIFDDSPAPFGTSGFFTFKQNQYGIVTEIRRYRN